jgi:hypothetical protein
LIIAHDDCCQFFSHEGTESRGIGNLPVWNAQIGAKG